MIFCYNLKSSQIYVKSIFIKELDKIFKSTYSNSTFLFKLIKIKFKKKNFFKLFKKKLICLQFLNKFKLFLKIKFLFILFFNKNIYLISIIKSCKPSFYFSIISGTSQIYDLYFSSIFSQFCFLITATQHFLSFSKIYLLLYYQLFAFAISIKAYFIVILF